MWVEGAVGCSEEAKVMVVVVVASPEMRPIRRS